MLLTLREWEMALATESGCVREALEFPAESNIGVRVFYCQLRIYRVADLGCANKGSKF